MRRLTLLLVLVLMAIGASAITLGGYLWAKKLYNRDPIG
jgi:nitrogen fixation-related uncharacterized protein